MLKEILIVLFMGFLCWGCSTFPEPKHKDYDFPNKKAFVVQVKKPYRLLGQVHSKVNFQSLDAGREEDDLCRNYFNKSVKELVKFSEEKGGDAVVNVRSVVFFEDGRHQLYTTPQCADDGFEGQILTQGDAIEWKDPTTPVEVRN